MTRYRRLTPEEGRLDTRNSILERTTHGPTAILYLRTSANGDAGDKDLEDQERTCREWCEYHELEVVDVVCDRAAGIGHEASVLRIFDEERASVVVAASGDRLTRSFAGWHVLLDAALDHDMAMKFLGDPPQWFLDAYDGTRTTFQGVKDNHKRMQEQLDCGATAIIYTRSATTSQSPDLDACSDQERVCRHWLEYYGWSVVDVVHDRGVKGREESAQHVMRLIKEHRASIIVAVSTGRFTREYPEWVELYTAAESRGMRILSVEDTVDPSAGERFFMHMKAILAQGASEES